MRTQQVRGLVEKILGMPFADYVEPRRDAGRSWEQISEELSAQLGVTVSRETVRRWYRLPR